MTFLCPQLHHTPMPKLNTAKGNYHDWIGLVETHLSPPQLRGDPVSPDVHSTLMSYMPFCKTTHDSLCNEKKKKNQNSVLLRGGMSSASLSIELNTELLFQRWTDLYWHIHFYSLLSPFTAKLMRNTWSRPLALNKGRTLFSPWNPSTSCTCWLTNVVWAATQ